MEVVQAVPPGSPSDVAEGVLTTTDFVDCYQTHYRRLVRALRLSGADHATAEDVAQEAFSRALVHWRRVRRGSNPPGYVYRTAFRLLQRAQRRPGAAGGPRAGGSDGAGASSPAAGAAAGESAAGESAAPADSAAPTESAALVAVTVAAALANMPPRRRACAVMCLVVGLPVREAAEALGIADGTVRKHLEEARRDLREAVPPG
jgi:RNA polymerase sigma-70 factor (ECF subfamily)